MPEIKSILVNTVPAEKEKDIVKKSTSTSRLSNVFKVKFKKDDFLSKKTQGKLSNCLIFFLFTDKNSFHKEDIDLYSFYHLNYYN